MVEHDVAPEDMEPVLEEPHRKEAENIEAEAKTTKDQSPPSEADQNQSSVPYAAGMSTFLSGIASMVQTTVSCTMILFRYLSIYFF